MLRAILFAVAVAGVAVTGDFVHPGVLFGAEQLASVKQQYAAGVEPFVSQFAKAESYFVTSRNSAAGPPPNGTITCGSYSHPDIGCTEAGQDSESAVIQTYLWLIGGNETYARNAVAILNHYAYTLKAYTDSNAPLQAAWDAAKFARAAELLSANGAPWAPADMQATKELFMRVHLPLIYGGSCANGNWELAMIEAMAGISVFTNNATLFNHTLDMWRARVPAYFYIHTDGPGPLPEPHGCNFEASWYNQTVFNASVDGVAQETCRDFDHTGYGVEASISIAETARIQGIDLYGEQQDRLVAALEFHAKWMNAGAAAGKGVNVTSPLLCSGAPLGLYNAPTYQVGLTHYSGRMGLPLPNTRAYVENILWAMPDATSMFLAVFEPLTHGAAAPASSSEAA